MDDREWAQKFFSIYALGYAMGVEVMSGDRFDRHKAKADRDEMIAELRQAVAELRREATKNEIDKLRAQALWVAAMRLLEEPGMAEMLDAEPAPDDTEARRITTALNWLRRAVMASSDALRPAREDEHA